MSSTHRKLLFVFLLTILARICFHLYTNFTADDAFITFRYAENLADGNGFVYNDGERVLGTSTPLFTFLVAIFALFHFPLISTVFAFTIIASGLTAAIIFRWAERLRFGEFAILPAIAYALWPRSIPSETSGMETALFTLLVTASLYYSYRGLHVYSTGVATLAALTRPEGLLALGIVGFAALLREPRHAWRYVVVSATLLIPWLVFSTWYFGSPIPNSVSAKLALYSQFGYSGIGQNLSYLLALHTFPGWVMVLLAAVGAWWIRQKQHTGTIEILWLLAMLSFFTLSRTLLFFWYVAPMYPVYLLFIFAGAVHLLKTVSGNKIKRELQLPMAMLFVTVSLLWTNASSFRYHRNYQATLEVVHKRIGNYLRLTADANELIAAEDIGYIGYYSKLRILDRDGLISPEIIPYNRAGRYASAVFDHKPDWVVASRSSPISPFLQDPDFLLRYEEQLTFSGSGIDYITFRQIR